MAFDRATGIGGSDAAVLLELSPWRDITDLWLEKTRHPAWSPPAENDAMRWGTLLEPLVRAEYERQEGAVVETGPVWDRPFDPDGFKGAPCYWSKDHIRYAHIDGWVRDGDGFGLWEGKTSSNAAVWEDGVPGHYEAQAQHYMEIFDAPWCDVSVLLPGGDFRTYRLTRRPDWGASIATSAKWFWTACVVPKEPPHELEEERLIYPVSDEAIEPVDLSALDAAAIEYLSHQDAIKQSKAQMAGIREQIERQIGPAPGGYGPGWRVSWKSGRAKKDVGWEHIAAAYRALLDEVVEHRDALPADVARRMDPDAIAVIPSLYTTTRAVPRPFRLTAAKED